jgi:hypothetical protein
MYKNKYTCIKINIHVYIGGLNAQIVILSDALNLSQGRVSTQNEVFTYIYNPNPNRLVNFSAYIYINIYMYTYIYMYMYIYSYV